MLEKRIIDMYFNLNDRPTEKDWTVVLLIEESSF